MRRTFNVAVSLTKNDYAEFELRPPINMVSGDHGTNILKFTVYDKGLPIDLSGNIAKITCKTPSGSRQQQDMTISSPQEGKMEVVLDQRFFTEGGTYLAEVQLYDPANLKVRATLPRFTYDVDTSLLEEHRVVANEQFSILQQMVDTVASAEERSIEALDTATRAMNIATQKGDKATEEANRAKNEADRAKNEADRAWAADFAKHVTLNAETQQKFDFIKNKVVQDGLVGAVFENNPSIIEIKKASKYTIQFVGKYNLTHGMYSAIFGMYHKNGTPAYYYLDSPTANEQVLRLRVGDDVPDTTAIVKNYNELFTIKSNLIIQIDETESTVTIVLNGIKNTRRYTLRNAEDTFNLHLLKTTIAGSNFNGDVAGLLVYNRQLTTQEIQHNFSVLNNSPSIKELHTTDSTGKTSILRLASDSYHCEMASGRTLEEEYTSLLGRFGKEIDSPDGSAIQVNDGISGKVLKMSIKGQTVKNYLNGKNDFEFDNEKSQGIRIKNTSKDARKIVFTANKKYVVNFYVSKIDFGTSHRKTLGVAIRKSDNSVHYFYSSEIKLGLNTIELLSTLDFTIESFFIAEEQLIANMKITTDYVTVIDESDTTKVNSYIPFGLNSTQAIINNNGQSYPIYANEEDKVNKKVILIDTVGSTQNSLEILEDGSGVFTQNVKRVLCTDKASDYTGLTLENTNTVGIELSTPDRIMGRWSIVSNLFNLVYPYTQDLEGYSSYDTGNNIIIKVNKNKLSELTKNAFIKYLVDNKVEFIYKLATPIITYIPKEAMPTILTHKTNILDVGSAVKSSSFKVTVPIDQIATINAELEAIKAVLNSPSNLLLSAKYVEDEFNKNNKLESEMMN